MPWTAILSFLAQPLKQWQELRAAKHNAKVAAQENRVRLLANEQSHNHEWEMAQLEDKDKGLRYVSFLLFVLPFVVAVFSPERVRDYFEVSLSAIPEWWKQVYVAITGAVWGLSSLKNSLPSLLGGAWHQVKVLEAQGKAMTEEATTTSASGTPKVNHSPSRQAGPRSKR